MLPWTPRAVDWALCLFCFLVPWTVAGANIGWGAVLAALLAYKVAGAPVDFKAARGPLAAALCLYLAAALYSSALGWEPRRSLSGFNKDLHKLWIFALMSAAFAARRPGRAPAFMAAGFALAAVIGVGQSLWALIAEGTWQRAHALVHPVVFGGQMAVALLGACSVLLRPPESALGERRLRFLASALAILFAAALLLSMTRAASLAFLSGLIVATALLPERRKLALALLPVALALGAWASVSMGRLRSEPLGRELAAWREAGGAAPRGGPLMRLALWDAAWRMGRDHPWTGVGPRNFRQAFARYEPRADSDWGDAHNVFLHQFAERGLPGLAALLILGAVFVGRALQRAALKPEAWTLWSAGASVAFVVMNLTETALETELAWMLALLVWIWAERSYRSTAPSTVRS